VKFLGNYFFKRLKHVDLNNSICDGIATLVMVSMLTDDGYKRENFPTLVRQQSCLQMIVNQIM